MTQIMVAMSGGVDSSLAAALLHEQGHQVVGVTMHLWNDDDDRLVESLCCAAEMAESARRVCAQLAIPYYVFNYQREFRRHVIDYFVQAYAQGLTPNPCLECNREIKFRALLERRAPSVLPTLPLATMPAWYHQTLPLQPTDSTVLLIRTKINPTWSICLASRILPACSSRLVI